MRASRAIPALPIPVKRLLAKLGADISAARRRRRIPVELMAERAFVGRNTITRVEKGDPRVSMGIYATVLFVLGLSERLSELADVSTDRLGLDLKKSGYRREFVGRARPAENVMERELLVHLDQPKGPVLVGRLWSRTRGAKESASFEYDRTWLARPSAFGLDPDLPLERGQFHTNLALFNAFTDPAPDRWGQTLLRRNERARARREKRQPRTLFTIDFLTLVDDETRLGALRFQESSGGPFVSAVGKRVPPLLELPSLLSATSRVIDEKETDDELLLLLAPGTSLGGARPKASVRDKDGHLLVAKFPRKDDEWPVTRWEAALLTLAVKAGVEVSPWRLQTVLKRPVLMVRRFDRRDRTRVHFMSALTAIRGSDNETRSYLEIVDALRRDGARVEADLKQLWRRVVFNILVSNTDDHLRNHGFLREDAGWILAPAYDLNPMPLDVKPRVHALAIDDADATASLETALAVAPSFGIAKPNDARAIAREVGTAVVTWRDAAAKSGIKSNEIERMESAFEHDDLRRAIGAPRAKA